MAELLERARDKSWAQKVRGTLIYAVAAMAPEQAPKLLSELIHDPKFDMIESALGQLAGVDPAAAKDEARRLLDGPRAEWLTGSQLRAAKHWASVTVHSD